VLLDDAGVKPKAGWDSRCIGLSGLSRPTIRFEVEVYSPSGDSTADWVTFGRFSVLRAPEPAGPRSSGR
jgi:hypothetical protein